MNYSVVVVTYNRIRLLKECLECIDNQILKFSEIIVVNNCSTDGTTDFLNKFKKNRNDIILINTKKNLGGSGGFELGIKSISKQSDYVLLIDDDAMLDKDFLNQIDIHRENDIFAYSGTVFTNDKIDTSHRRRLKSKIFMTKIDVPKKEYEKESFIYDLSTFCGLVVSTRIVDKIGVPRGDYFIWYDDTEYSLRINQYTKIKNVNSSFIDHKTIISIDNSLNWKSYYGYRNQIDVGKKYSKYPRLYILVRYAFHIYKIFQLKKLLRKDSNNIYYKECIKLHKTVIKDSKNNVFGLNTYYYPGKNLSG